MTATPPRVVTLVPGDGIGPEITAAVTSILEAAGADLAWERQDAGEASIKVSGMPLPPATLASIRRTKVCLKGPVTTPIGTGFKSVNVTLRQDARSLREPEAREERSRRRVPLRRPRPRRRAREHREPLLRNRARRRAGRRRVHQGHHGEGLHAHRALRLRVGPRARPQEDHDRAQGEHHEALGRPLSRQLPERRGRTTPTSR